MATKHCILPPSGNCLLSKWTPSGKRKCSVLKQTYPKDSSRTYLFIIAKKKKAIREK